jgi:hypothetical protein
VIVVAK